MKSPARSAIALAHPIPACLFDRAPDLASMHRVCIEKWIRADPDFFQRVSRDEIDALVGEAAAIGRRLTTSPFSSDREVAYARPEAIGRSPIGLAAGARKKVPHVPAGRVRKIGSRNCLK